MDLLKCLIDEDKKDYKCYDILKKLVQNNDFYKLLEQGIKENKIFGFSEDLWEQIRTQNIRTINSFEDVFIQGLNLGNCTNASKQLSYSLNSVFICGGTQTFLIGTLNSEDGRHTWTVSNGKIYDTSLMLIIDEDYAKELGYIEENRYNPLENNYYCAAREFTLDPELRPNRKK